MKQIKKAIAVLISVLFSLNISLALPVELSSFTASVKYNNVTLNWTTASETNNSGFLVQRKLETQTLWTDVGYVDGNGTTSEPHDYIFHDDGLSIGSYNYRLKQNDYNGTFEYYDLSSVVEVTTISISQISSIVPDKFSLSQNYPNPFNPGTVISYQLAVSSFVSMKVYDALGKEIVTIINQKQIAGTYETTFDGSILSSGIYFYSLSADGNLIDTKQMILLK